MLGDSQMPRAKISAQEKKENKAVRDYLNVLAEKNSRRGRKRTVKSIEAQILVIQKRSREASPTKRLDLIQERLDLEKERDKMVAASKLDIRKLESDFVKAAAAYGARRGISYMAWREVGVSAGILKAARISRRS